jgi:DNA-binding NtrC family response regulator
MSPEALLAMTLAPWPGNVRELASVIERAVVFGADESVRLEGLASLPGAAAAAPELPASFRSEAPSTLRNLSREYTAWVLVQTGGNKEHAAHILGVDLSTLYRWQRARQD